MDEKRDLCQIIFKQVMYDFEIREIVDTQPNVEYQVLFKVISDA